MMSVALRSDAVVPSTNTHDAAAEALAINVPQCQHGTFGILADSAQRTSAARAEQRLSTEKPEA